MSINYRVETFAYLVCNAWELLLKAKLLDEAKIKTAIYYPSEGSQRPRTLSLRDCLKRLFEDDRDSTRRNVERVADLRDEAAHLVIGEIPKDVLALLQACVLNYHRKLNDWFGLSLSDRVPVGMMTLVYDLSPDQFDLANPVMRRRLGKDAAEYLTDFEASIRTEHEDLGRPEEFSISIRYSIGIEKRSDAGDIRLIAGADGLATRVVEVAKDPSRTHPYRQTEVVAELKAALVEAPRFTSYDVQAIFEVYQVKKRPEFHYRGEVPGNPDQYSKEFVDWVVRQHSQDASFLTETRNKAKQLRSHQGS